MCGLPPWAGVLTRPGTDVQGNVTVAAIIALLEAGEPVVLGDGFTVTSVERAHGAWWCMGHRYRIPGKRYAGIEDTYLLTLKGT